MCFNNPELVPYTPEVAIQLQLECNELQAGATALACKHLTDL